MRRVKAIGRLGGLAIGLGIGAALAASPGIASAAPDIDISFDGMDIFSTPGHTAEAFSGTNDFAIASGTDSLACAGAGPCSSVPGGEFDFASASGSHSESAAVVGNFDTALANGDHSIAAVGGVAGSNDDFASAFGLNALAGAGGINGVAGSNDIAMVLDPFGTVGSTTLAGGGNFDFAEVFGDGLTTGTAATGANFLSDILSGLPL